MLQDDPTPVDQAPAAAPHAAVVLPIKTSRPQDLDAQAEAAVDRLLEKGPLPLVVVIGLGEGHLLEALSRRSPSTRVLALEPEGAPARSLKHRDLAQRISEGTLLVLRGPDYSGLADAFRFFPTGVVAPPVLLAPGLAKVVRAEALAGAKSAAARLISGVRANDQARRQFAGTYLINTLRNLPFITAEGDANALAGLFAGLPAIVVGAGPSLDSTLPALRELQHRAVLIAVDTACRPLLAASIRPHLVVSVDPTEINARHLALLPETRGIWFVGEGSVDSSVFPQFAQRTFTFKVSQHHPWPLANAHNVDRGTLQAWGSVLTTAFDLAVGVGCNPIVFAGADLAYTRGLQYCRNTIHEDKWKDYPTDESRAEHFRGYLDSRPHLTTRDLSGKDTISTPPFVQFRDWIVAKSKTVGRRVINATGGGILHGGAIAVTAIDALQFDERADHQSDIQRRLHTAWASSSAQRDTAQEALDGALAYGAPLPLKDWFAFGGDTAPMGKISGTAAWTGNALAQERRVNAYLKRQRTAYDSRIQSLDDARTLSHGNFDIAAAQAPAQQVHVLLDLLQRRYATSSGGIEPTLKALSSLPGGLRALDVGCGVGRLMEPLVSAGVHVDGVDFSARMLEFARQNPALASSQFFLSEGRDCGGALDGSYDLVYSQLCFRYIHSRRVRQSLLRTMARALRAGGMVMVEMRFFANQSASALPAPHVPWSAESLDIHGDLGSVDMRATPDELHLIYQDFARHFSDVRLQIVDVPPHERFKQPPHLLVSGSVGPTLTQRINARVA